MEFFGISAGGDFDIVAALIQNIGAAWDALKSAVMAVIDIFSVFYESISGLITGQMDLQTAILNIWNGLATNIPIILQFLYTYFLSFVGQVAIYAIQAGMNFLNGVASYISQLPGRILTYLIMVVTYITAQTLRWVNVARARASQLVTNVISFLRQLPGRALSALLGVVSSIVSAGSQWVSNARNKAHEIVNSVYNTLSGLPGKISSALSGVVSAITKPFQDAYNSVKGVVDNIISKASEVANISLPAFGGDAWGGDIVPDARGGDFTATYISESGSDSVDVSGDINLNLSLKDVPAHIDTDALIRMLKDKNVIRALVENRDFQSIDSMVKSRINYKVNRSRGV